MKSLIHFHTSMAAPWSREYEREYHYFNTLYGGDDFISILAFNINYVSERGPCCFLRKSKRISVCPKNFWRQVILKTPMEWAKLKIQEIRFDKHIIICFIFCFTNVIYAKHLSCFKFQFVYQRNKNRGICEINIYVNGRCSNYWICPCMISELASWLKKSVVFHPLLLYTLLRGQHFCMSLPLNRVFAIITIIGKNYHEHEIYWRVVSPALKICPQEPTSVAQLLLQTKYSFT